MYSKKKLIKSRPQWLKTVLKYSRTFVLLLQQTTNQITPLASTLEKPDSFTASIYARIARISTIARIAKTTRIFTIARII